MVHRCIDETIGENGSEGRRGGLALDLSASGHVEFGGAGHSIGGGNGGRYKINALGIVKALELWLDGWYSQVGIVPYLS